MSAPERLQNVVTSRHFHVGVAIRNEHLPSRSHIYDGVLDFALERSRIRAFLLPIRDGNRPRESVLARLDGLITVSDPKDGWIREVATRGLPVVDCHGAFRRKICTVWSGHPQLIAYDFTKSLGRRAIGYVGTRGIDEEWPGLRAHISADAQRLGLEFSEFFDIEQDPSDEPWHMLEEDREEPLQEFLRLLPKPAAVWCLTDELAVLVWRVADQLGLHVPNDLALMGCGDHPCAIHGTAGLTSLNLSGNRVGFEAARLLYDHLTGSVKLDPTAVHLISTGASVIERSSTGGSSPANRGVHRAWRLLEDYPREGLTVDTLIEVSKVPRISFYKQFKKTFGMSPGTGIRMSRIRKAKMLLAGSDMSISKVARQCGFSGESDFSNFFKREVGIPPQIWRLPPLPPAHAGANPQKSALE
jgi:DNA-binding LacI/PurR family transcriptional regulator